VLVQDFLHHSAERLPDKVALVCDNQRLTYREIDLAANRLANALRAAGVRRGDRVAIYLPDSVASVVAIFAALKAALNLCWLAELPLLPCADRLSKVKLFRAPRLEYSSSR
jgi:non-ribosomal peptide synthetase component F